jgi:serine/threonine protein kinase
VARLKLYGNRYESVGRDVGGGGQGDVLRVRDTLDPLKAEYALKRLKDAARYERFLNEIEALRGIDHPNVIKIIDHSGEGVPGDTKHKYWFVMPLASGNLEQRVGLYRGDLDGVLRVAIQLADALGDAHAKGIIHRDVKPPNILFPRLDHDVWLADFGICHLGAAKERLTREGEIVGPRAFIAPELEAGGQIPVSGAADIYSLGKVIYYMLSGGGLIAREQLNSAEFDDVFTKGERSGLLRTLLSRMIAPPNRRIGSASEVRDELRRIEHWDQHARSLALSSDALASIDALQRRATDRIRISEENDRIRASQQNLAKTVTSNICDWLQAELTKTADLLRATYEVEVSPIAEKSDFRFGAEPPFGRTGPQIYLVRSGRQIAFIDKSASFKQKCVLKFFICEGHNVSVKIGNRVAPLVDSDPRMAIVPYISEYNPPDYKLGALGGFLKDKIVLARLRAELVQRTGRRHLPSNNEPLIAKTFVGSPVNLLVEFGASEWPSIIDAVKRVFSESVKIAVEFSASDIRSTGA